MTPELIGNVLTVFALMGGVTLALIAFAWLGMLVYNRYRTAKWDREIARIEAEEAEDFFQKVAQEAQGGPASFEETLEVVEDGEPERTVLTTVDAFGRITKREMLCKQCANPYLKGIHTCTKTYDASKPPVFLREVKKPEDQRWVCAKGMVPNPEALPMPATRELEGLYAKAAMETVGLAENAATMFAERASAPPPPLPRKEAYDENGDLQLAQFPDPESACLDDKLPGGAGLIVHFMKDDLAKQYERMTFTELAKHLRLLISECEKRAVLFKAPALKTKTAKRPSKRRPRV